LGSELRVAGSELRVTGCGLRVAGYGFRVTGSGLVEKMQRPERAKYISPMATPWVLNESWFQLRPERAA